MKRTPIKRKTRIRRRSDKKQRKDEVRREVLEQLVAERGDLCQARVLSVCQTFASDGHEILSRGRGGDPADPDNVLLVCRKCHDWIHAHPREALAKGLLKNSWDD